MTASDHDDDEPPALDRRELLRLLGAGIALAGLSACTQSPREKILPYARQPLEVSPGIPVSYATSMALDGFAMGLLVTSHEGRPTKIEGNPGHPASLGATGALQQASLLDLYEPGRTRLVRHDSALSSWDDLLQGLQKPAEWRPWFVLPPQSSPLVGALLGEIRRRHPAARFSLTSPISRQRVYEATRALFGRSLEPGYDFARARVVVSLDADFLGAMPMSVRWSRDFAAARRIGAPGGTMNRLYALEPMLTTTGSLADHRIAVRPSALAGVAGAILREVAALAAPGASMPLPEALLTRLPRAEDCAAPELAVATARDLAGARGASLVVAGDQAPLELQLLAHALNAVLGNWGQTAWFSDPALLDAGDPLAELARALDTRSVDTVLILDSNPVYWAPASLELGRRLQSAPESLHLTAFDNETSRACSWVAPLSHYLESWGDARAQDGTVSFVQPLIEPLYPSRSVLELLAACAGRPTARGHTLLTEHYRAALGAGFEATFEEYLRSGMVADSASPRRTPDPDFSRVAERLGAAAAPATGAPAVGSPAADALELHFEVSPNLYDGRFANNAWLLELPHPITKQTWGNAALIGPALASALGTENGRVLELEVGGARIEAPALIVPGHAPGVVSIALGYGQQGPELIGSGVGTSAYRLRAGDSDSAGPLRVRLTERSEALAITQDHGRTRGRPLALRATLDEYRRRPDLTAELRGRPPSLLPLLAGASTGPAWAMTIDTSICTGCSACVIACQSENNVPVVGKEDVQRGREMHWLRIDRYFEGPESDPHVVHQPMACQHCEAAPCEYVCPVNATVHSPDGLNEMVYNRCIGTRFCSNNCPYKVRRFNWFEFTGLPNTEQLARNPDVTVRERGVMEKCSFCVQRIRRVEMRARIEQREIAPGEVVSACQQACPTQAIQFGSLGDTGTKLVEWRQEGRAYAALAELGTRPRTLYLARIDNPNPELEG